MTGIVQSTSSLTTEADSVLATGQGNGSITPARLRQLIEDIVVSSVNQAFVQSLGNYADDASAAAGGVPVGGLYRNGNFICVRLS